MPQAVAEGRGIARPGAGRANFFLNLDLELREGIVRLTERELGDKKRSRLSRGELTPFSERGSAVLLEDIAAVEVAVLVEVIVYRGMGGGEFPQGLYISELRYRSFSSSERLVGILGSIVEPPTALLIGSIAAYLHRRSVRPKAIGYDRLRSAVTLHRAL